MTENTDRMRYWRQAYVTRNGIRRADGRVPPGKLRHSGAVLLSLHG